MVYPPLSSWSRWVLLPEWSIYYWGTQGTYIICEYQEGRKNCVYITRVYITCICKPLYAFYIREKEKKKNFFQLHAAFADRSWGRKRKKKKKKHLVYSFQVGSTFALSPPGNPRVQITNKAQLNDVSYSAHRENTTVFNCAPKCEALRTCMYICTETEYILYNHNSVLGNTYKQSKRYDNKIIIWCDMIWNDGRANSIILP